jgi:hypothetical protein
VALGVDRFPDPPERRLWHYEYDCDEWGNIERRRVDDSPEEEESAPDDKPEGF